METFAIAFVTAFVTIILNHLFEVYRKELSQKRELHISFYAKIKRTEEEIFSRILRINYGWGNPDDYKLRIHEAQIIYERMLNDFYEQLLLNDAERKKTREVIVSFRNNIIDKVIESEINPDMRNEAYNYYAKDLQISTEELRRLYLKNSNTIITKIKEWFEKENDKLV